MAEFVKSSFDQQACLDIKVTEEAFPVDLVHIQWIHSRVVGLNERHR